MKPWILLVIIFSILVVSAYTLQNQSRSTPSRYTYTTPAIIGNAPISIDRVNSPLGRQLGLSGEKFLRENQGLLFAFEENSMYGIWMKDMNFAIDVVWFDENLRVVSIRKEFSPSSYPEVAYPTAPAKYVLEVPAGFADTHQIKIGDTLRLQE